MPPWSSSSISHHVIDTQASTASPAAALDAAQQQRGAPIPVFTDVTMQPTLLSDLSPLVAGGLSGVVAPLEVLLASPGGLQGVMEGLQGPSAPDAVVETPAGNVDLVC